MPLRLPRLIPRLDIKGANVVKGINFEGLRIVGNPAGLAEKYSRDADEILYVDTVASLYGRNQLTEILIRATAKVFIPITVAGGIKSRADAKRLLDAGADKVCINTAAIRDPALIDELSNYYGAQALAVEIQAKRNAAGWECYTDNGRERSGRDAVRWAEEAAKRGAGEILLTSIDQEGTRRGFDTALLEAVSGLDVPIVICGGMGTLAHLDSVKGLAHGIAMASVLHYGNLTIEAMRRYLGQDVEDGTPQAAGCQQPEERIA